MLIAACVRLLFLQPAQDERAGESLKHDLLTDAQMSKLPASTRATFFPTLLQNSVTVSCTAMCDSESRALDFSHGESSKISSHSPITAVNIQSVSMLTLSGSVLSLTQTIKSSI